ncbi:MAG: DUF4010 domain-containing protein [Pseudomonadota bacterium]
MSIDTANLIGIGVASASGLLIGIERERRKGSGPNRHFVGLRSFTLVAVMGALAQTLAMALVVTGALAVLGLTLISHWRDRSGDPGITTELALFLTYLLGVNAIDGPAVSAGAAVLLAALLNLRDPMHHFARHTLRTGELRDFLILAGAALVVLPLLPNAPSVWLLGANAHRLGSLVVIIMAMQACAHIAMRLAGARWGLAMTGVASGFVSGTATVASMGTRCHKDAALLRPCVAGALASQVANFTLLTVIALAIAPDHARDIAPLLASGLAAACMITALAMLGKPGKAPHLAPPGRAFAIGQAIVFAAMLSLATAAVGYVSTFHQQGAVQVAALLAGLADMHAAATSVMSLAAAGALTPGQVEQLFLIALAANMLPKILAALSGGPRFFLQVSSGLLAILAASALHWLLSMR